MIPMLKTLCITLLFVASLAAQSGQDSLNLSAMVRQQITKVQTEKEQPKTAPAVKETKTNNSSILPENVFIVLFALAELLAGGMIIRYYLRKRKTEQNSPVPAPHTPDETAPRRRLTKEEAAKLRTDVVCQLALIKTQEELNREAKKLNIGAGELELAIRLQNMAGSN